MSSPEERVPSESLPLWLLQLLLLPRLLLEGPLEMDISMDTPSSSEDWRWLGNALPTGESAAKPRVGLLPANLCQTGHVPGTSSSWDDCGVAQGWNGRAVAERVESSCIEENRLWSSQRARLRFSFSILLHPTKISLASEMLTHCTLHLAKYPTQVGMLYWWRRLG